MVIMICRYYLVEKAKDANIVGILVGTLGVGMSTSKIILALCSSCRSFLYSIDG